MKNTYREGWRAVLVSSWLGVVAFILIMFITGPRGIGMTSDSVVYFQAAKYAAMGEGFLTFSKRGVLEPLVHYPPLYPAVLAIGSYLGMDTFGWARIVNAFLFGLNVFLISMIAFFITGRRRAALMAGWLALIFVQMVEIHSRALTEPLFLSLTLLSLWILMCYLENNRRVFLVAAALLAGLSMLVRYGGLSVVVAEAIVLSVHFRQDRFGKAREFLSFLVMALCFPVMLAWRNLSLFGKVNDFHFGFLPQAIGNVTEGLDTLSTFLLPVAVPAAIRWLVLGLFLWALTALVRDVVGDMARGEGGERMRGAWLVLGTFIAVYLVGAVLTICTVWHDDMVSLDRRILLPIPVVAMVLSPTLLRRKYFEGISRRMVGVRAMVLLLFLGVMFLRTAQLAKSLYHSGIGYNSKAWSETVLVKTVQTLADDVPVYSNNPQAFYFYAGRPAILIPQLPADVSFFPSIEQVREHFVADHGVAVIFGEASFSPQSLWGTVVRTIPLVAYIRDGWGAIYGFKNSAPTAAAAVQLKK